MRKIGHNQSGSALSVKAMLFLSATLTSLALPTSVFAQAGTSATPAKDAALETEEEPVIVVSGTRASLEAALTEKLKAETIIDGISADDVGSTPDLNLGEALQRIPGVQIDRSAERREASISVRGLPGRFSKTTLMGQSVASASLGNNTNPFGIFDASIFSGANVIKSFSADTASGGIAANVDLRLRSALERSKSSFVIRSELQYEETTKKANPSIFVGGSQHLSDSFGVYANVAYSKQNFRRDRIGINTYGSYVLGARGAATPPVSGYREFLTANPGVITPIPTANLNDSDTVILFPGDVRQEARQDEGSRLSGSAGLEWEVSDGLKLRLDGIYTRRNLDSSVLDNLYYTSNDTNGQALAREAPIFIGRYSRGAIVNGVAPAERDIYLAPSVRFTDVGVNTGIRDNTADQSSWAVYPQINFANDDWKIDIIGGLSKARSISKEVQNEIRSRQVTGRITPAAQAQNFLDVFTGLDNFRDFSQNLTTDSRIFDLTGATFIPTANDLGANLGRAVAPALVAGSTTALPQLSLLVTGTNRAVLRDLFSVEGQIQRFVNFGPFTSFEIGGRYDKENADAFLEANAGVGLNLNALTSAIYNLNVAQQAGNFFGGLVPAAEGDNFRSFDLDAFNTAIFPATETGLFPAGATAANYTRARFSDAYLTRASLLPNSAQQIRTFTSERENIEAFAMARFDLEEYSNTAVKGNFGLRYVRSKFKGILAQNLTDTIDDAEQTPQRDLEFWLPSLNVAIAFTPKLVARGAYYRTFDAFDLGEFSPAPTVLTTTLGDTDGDGSVDDLTGLRVAVSDLDLNPRRGEAFDFNLTWNNRSGSVFSIAYFNKKFDDIARQTICPEGESPFGVPAPLYNDEFLNCRANVSGARGINNPTVVITRNVNLPNPLNISGLEFQVQQKLDFLPGFWKGFGIVGNATRVTSKSKDPTRQLFNVAKWTANAIGYYENEWLSTRLAYNWQSAYDLEGTGSSTGGNRSVRPRGQFDFTAGIKPIKNLEFRFEIFNITNSIRQEYEQSTLLPRRYDYDGRTASVSAQIKF